MKVFVNDRPFDLLPGMTVRHALIAAGLLRMAAAGRKARDAWGNEVGLDGGLSEGEKIYISDTAPPSHVR